MANYASVYAALARRAVREGVTDAEAFIERAVAAGMSPATIERQLLADLNTGGPIFGKFIRSLEGSAASAVLAAEKQGEAVARAYGQELLRLADLDDILETANADEMESVERRLDGREALVWIATLVNTCHLCLPLHGKMDTREGWAERGLDPEYIHQNAGWSEKSKCQCQLVPVSSMDNPGAVVDPLVREKVKAASGASTSKRTQRAVAQRDIDRARAAIDKAMESEQGRRTLRLMGQIDKE